MGAERIVLHPQVLQLGGKSSRVNLFAFLPAWLSLFDLLPNLQVAPVKNGPAAFAIQSRLKVSDSIAGISARVELQRPDHCRNWLLRETDDGIGAFDSWTGLSAGGWAVVRRKCWTNQARIEYLHQHLQGRHWWIGTATS